MSARVPSHVIHDAAVRTAAALHGERAAAHVAAMIGANTTAALVETGSALGRGLAEQGVATTPLDPAQPWRAGVVPVVELGAGERPEWLDRCPHGADVVLVAELDPEGGSRAVRRRGPAAPGRLVAMLESLPGRILAVDLVPWQGRAPFVVAHVQGGDEATPTGDRADPVVAGIVAELERLTAVRDRADQELADRGRRDLVAEDAAIAAAMHRAACARGWFEYALKAPSRSGLTMRALRTARRRPIALRRVPGQVARGLLRRHRRDRLVVGAADPVPLAAARVRAETTGDAREAVSGLTTTVVALAHDDSEAIELEHRIRTLSPSPQRIVVRADPTDGGWDLAAALEAVDTDLVAVWPAGVQADGDVLEDLACALVETGSRFVAAPVRLLHLTELGLDLRRDESLGVGYFAPLEDGIVMAAAVDLRRFAPAARDRPVTRLHDAARATGATTYVVPDIEVARHLGEMSAATADEYHDAFGRLDESVDEAAEATDAEPAADDVVARMVAARHEARDRCARLGAGTLRETETVQGMLTPDLGIALALDWMTVEVRWPRVPPPVRAPSRWEVALADLFGESPRLRDE